MEPKVISEIVLRAFTIDCNFLVFLLNFELFYQTHADIFQCCILLYSGSQVDLLKIDLQGNFFSSSVIETYFSYMFVKGRICWYQL